jgi:hypothetical protein
MERWVQWVIAILVVAGIIAMVAFARGDFGHDDLPPAPIVSVTS